MQKDTSENVNVGIDHSQCCVLTDSNHNGILQFFRLFCGPLKNNEAGLFHFFEYLFVGKYDSTNAISISQTHNCGPQDPSYPLTTRHLSVKGGDNVY